MALVEYKFANLGRNSGSATTNIVQSIDEGWTVVPGSFNIDHSGYYVVLMEKKKTKSAKKGSQGKKKVKVSMKKKDAVEHLDTMFEPGDPVVPVEAVGVPIPEGEDVPVIPQPSADVEPLEAVKPETEG
jgi:hypothetical protein